MGPAPARMAFSTVSRSVAASGRAEWSMGAEWTPCAADAGRTTLCLHAADSPRLANGSFLTVAGAGGGPPVRVRGAQSPAQCVRLEVLPAQAPRVRVYVADEAFASAAAAAGAAGAAEVNLTMGRAAFLLVTADAPNCAEALGIEPAPAPAPGSGLGLGLPDGASLVPLPAPGVAAAGEGCGRARAGVGWTPGLRMGGMGRMVCFRARETQSVAPDRCPGTQPQVRTRSSPRGEGREGGGRGEGPPRPTPSFPLPSSPLRSPSFPLSSALLPFPPHFTPLCCPLLPSRPPLTSGLAESWIGMTGSLGRAGS